MASLETLDEIQKWLEGIFQRLVHLLHYSEEQTVSPNIRKATAYMKKHLHENISLGDVADEVGISAPYLSLIFKEEQGIGFLDYFMELRLDKAKTLLLEEKYELKEIAAACGFQNYPYFFNVFKKKVGMTPGAYVKLNKS
jgi:two-component system response regulator YesN